MALDKVAISKEIKDVIIAPIPGNLIQERQGGGKKKLSYLSGSTIVDMLNNAFGYMWSWTVKEQWIEQSEPSINKWVNGVQQSDPSKWVTEKQGPVAHVLGTLTIYLKNGTSPSLVGISKDGYGSKSVLGKQNDQESIFKAAGTDAIKKAASLLGIGLELYRNEEQQAYFDEINYEDPWTDEELEKHKENRAYITNYIKEYQVTDDDFAEFVLSVTENSYSVTPENIDAIVNYIKEQIAEAK